MRDVLGRNDRKSDYTYDEEKPKDITGSLMKLSELSLMTSWQVNRISTRTMIWKSDSIDDSQMARAGGKSRFTISLKFSSASPNFLSTRILLIIAIQQTFTTDV